MAEIKIDEVVYHLDAEFKRALADTLKKFVPGVRVDVNAAFTYFQRRVYDHCSVWEKVPDSSVRP
jgi:hypothetical protein